MLKWMCAAAVAVLAAGPAFAQKTDLPDRPQKQIKPFDTDAIKEGIQAIKASGQCTVNFVVGWQGKAQDIAADCSVDGFAPYAVRAVQGAEWDAEIIKHELLDSFPMSQTFKFGAVAGPAVDPRGEKGPVLVSGVLAKDIERAINQVDQDGHCDVKLTIGADGKPKDITPNCTPEVYNDKINEAVAKMVFEPGQKDGKPTDWPGMSVPVNLAKKQKP